MVKQKRAMHVLQMMLGIDCAGCAQVNMQATAIEAYRSLKRQDGGKGATLQSLKEIVKQDARRKEEGAGQQ